MPKHDAPPPSHSFPDATLLPLAIIGVGLAWLAAGHTGPGRHQAKALRHQARKLGTQARETWHDTQDALSRSADTVSRRARDAGLGTVIEDHPLLAGFLGLALGAAIGAALPSTRVEEALLGDLGDGLIDRGSEAVDQVREGVLGAVG